ncbi:D-hexose-6-phosphate mutarotase [Endozoicomonas sp. Mp262]|uniref:D-hexose-6-phosphate mutarotase n=1 Tax=Endozoicomonas sp. Mp262 TaxID=2919499 RepID=UPI0021DA118A
MSIDTSLFEQTLMGNLPVLSVENSHAKAVISLYGGQVLSFKPHGEEQVLWLSPDAVFQEGKAIRGGIPLCWPWFGKRQEGGPNHGYARIATWELVEAKQLENGETQIVLSLDASAAATRPGFVDGNPVITIVVGRALAVTLDTVNSGDQPFGLSQALHSYFAVSDVEKIRIKGLQGTTYLDSTNNQQVCTQSGEVTIKGEVDRIYLNTDSTCIIDDPGLKRSIVVEKAGSNSTVVWNPGSVLAEAMTDIPSRDYASMVCVETATAPSLAKKLVPGEKHQITTRVFVRGC